MEISPELKGTSIHLI
nr:hypothetical protein [Tanacetum cinerariifolium]